MKVAVSASGASPDSNVDPRFGRCPYFVIVDTGSGEYEALENSSMVASQGAGIATAQMIAERQVSAVLTGNCGPNAYQALNAAGIDVITGVSGTVGKAIESFRSGEYRSSTAPNVDAHHGLGGDMGRGMQSGMGSSAAEDNSSGMMQVLQELKIQLDGLRSQVDDINSRIDQLHKND
ncbi:MAG: NifB/NifX family molybdenum-iron cluster-binding protein [Chloroflexota bacterium]